MKDGSMQLWLTNPESNHALLNARILDAEGNLLRQSGLLRPGEYLRSVAPTVLITEDTDAILLIMAYKPETYHNAGNIER